MMVAMGNTFALSEADCVLPVVPMFHVNAWGLALRLRPRRGQAYDAWPEPGPASLLEDLEQKK